MSSEGSATVQVVVRVRPMNDKEMKGNTLPVVTASTEKKEVTVIRGAGQRQQRTTYNFDNVLTSFSTQGEVFNQTIEPVIDDVLSGYECTMFAYGQTGTGKTHTMEGDFMSEDNRGVIPRAAQAIFERLSSEEFLEYTVKASYLEIYNEELADLLVQHGQDVKLQVCEDTRQRGRGIFVQNLSETTINGAADVLSLMQRAQERRKVGETKMNKHSSRSHCLFSLTVASKKRVGRDGAVMECSGKLHLVDLAGSECAKSAGNDDPKKERERKNINQSLLTLGRVISALREGNVQRIPYRDSKLTRLLQESLGGRCKTVIIATISPSLLAVEETLSTLNYAQAAHGIQNKPVATSYLKLGEGAQLKGDAAKGMSTAGASVQDWNQLECRLQYLQAELEEAQAALSRKHLQQQTIIDRAEEAEAERDRLTEELDFANQEVQRAREKSVLLEQALLDTQNEVLRKERVVEARRATEAKLDAEARALLGALQRSVADGAALQQKLEAQAGEEEERRAATREFRGSVRAMMEAMDGELGRHAAELGKLQAELVEQSAAAAAAAEQEAAALVAAAAAMRGMVEEGTGEGERVLRDAVERGQQGLEAAEAASREAGEAVKARVARAEAAVKAAAEGVAERMAAGEAAVASWVAEARARATASAERLAGLRAEQVAEVEASRAKVEEGVAGVQGAMEGQRAGLAGLSEAMAAYQAEQGALAERMKEVAERCEEVASEHAAGAEELRAGVEAAAAAHRAGVRHEAMAAEVEAARGRVKAALAAATEALEAQQAGLGRAGQKQREGTVDAAHEEGIKALEGAMAAFGEAQRERQRQQHRRLAEALEALGSDNASAAQAGAMRGLGAQAEEESAATGARLAAQRAGLEAAARQLVELEEERRMVEAVAEGQAALLRVQEEQRQRLAAQEEALEAQRGSLEAARRAQEEGRAALVEAVMSSVGSTLQAQVAQLQQKMEGDVAGMVQGSEGLSAHNKAMAAHNAALKQETTSLHATVTEQAEAWGANGRAVQALCEGFASDNADVSAMVAATCAATKQQTEAAAAAAEAWGESNEGVGREVATSMQENEAAVLHMEEALEGWHADGAALRAQTRAWGESNRAVEAMVATAVEESKAAVGTAAAAAATEEAALQGMGAITEAWAAADAAFQGAADEAVARAGALRERVEGAAAEVKGRQAEAAEAMAGLQGQSEAAGEDVALQGERNEAMQCLLAGVGREVEAAAGRAQKGVEREGRAVAEGKAAEEAALAALAESRPAVQEGVEAGVEAAKGEMAALQEEAAGAVEGQALGLVAAVQAQGEEGRALVAEEGRVMAGLRAAGAAPARWGLVGGGRLATSVAAANAAVAAAAAAEGGVAKEMVARHAEGAAGVAAAVGGYCAQVASADAAVEPPAPLQQPPFSTALSATPEEEAILADFQPMTEALNRPATPPPKPLRVASGLTATTSETAEPDEVMTEADTSADGTQRLSASTVASAASVESGGTARSKEYLEAAPLPVSAPGSPPESAEEAVHRQARKKTSTQRRDAAPSSAKKNRSASADRGGDGPSSKLMQPRAARSTLREINNQ